MAIDNDFIGFRFNGTHSSDLNIYRVSDGSRYNDNLLPNFQDKTAQVTGGDGTLYWESFYTQRQISIQIAFDSMTEQNYRQMRQVFNGKAYGQLIFDEAPYKYYYAKVQNSPQLKTICFDVNGTRIYKGEGSINFICYYPYAKSVHKFLDEFNSQDYPTKSQWTAASGMKPTKASYDGTGNTVYLYNAGDVPTDFCAYFPIGSSGSALSQIQIANAGVLTFTGIARKGSNDSYIRINTRTNLVEGCNSSYELTGTLYNQFINAGDFFRVPLGESTLSCSGAGCSKIEYDYLYY